MLAWDLEWGPQVEHLLRIARTGQRVPALERRPAPSSHLNWVWEGFTTLDRHRSWGQGFPQPISLSDVVAYAEMRRMDDDQRDSFLHWIRLLDGRYLKRIADRAKMG